MKLGKRIRYVLIITMMSIGLVVTMVIADTGSDGSESGIAFIEPFTWTGSNIAISETMASDFDQSTLNVSSTLQTNGTTVDAIGFDSILQSEGRYDGPDQSYSAYSFFIKNMSFDTLSVDYVLHLTQISYDMDRHIRILVIENDLSRQMYQREDHLDEGDATHEDQESLSRMFFESETIAFRGTTSLFDPSEVKSFRVIVWVGQHDPDIVDLDPRGHIKARLELRVNEAQSPRTATSADKKLWFTLTHLCIIEFDLRYKADSHDG